VPAANASPNRDSKARTRARARETPSVAQILPRWITQPASVVVADAKQSWVWTGSPPPLSQVVKSDTANVPGDHVALRRLNQGWKYAFAIPATATAYTVAWLMQHPLRALPALLVAGITLLVLIG
jgi:hypothetical protein